jgi:hypothetical protein
LLAASFLLAFFLVFLLLSVWLRLCFESGHARGKVADGAAKEVSKKPVRDTTCEGFRCLRSSRPRRRRLARGAPPPPTTAPAPRRRGRTRAQPQRPSARMLRRCQKRVIPTWMPADCSARVMFATLSPPASEASSAGAVMKVGLAAGDSRRGERRERPGARVW